MQRVKCETKAGVVLESRTSSCWRYWEWPTKLLIFYANSFICRPPGESATHLTPAGRRRRRRILGSGSTTGALQRQRRSRANDFPLMCSVDAFHSRTVILRQNSCLEEIYRTFCSSEFRALKKALGPWLLQSSQVYCLNNSMKSLNCTTDNFSVAHSSTPIHMCDPLTHDPILYPLSLHTVHRAVRYFAADFSERVAERSNRIQDIINSAA